MQKVFFKHDLAMKLSNRQPVCIIHCKEEGKKWNILQKRLQRVTFLSANEIETQLPRGLFHAVLVDEAHLLSEEKGRAFLVHLRYDASSQAENAEILSAYCGGICKY